VLFGNNSYLTELDPIQPNPWVNPTHGHVYGGLPVARELANTILGDDLRVPSEPESLVRLTHLKLKLTK